MLVKRPLQDPGDGLASATDGNVLYEPEDLPDVGEFIEEVERAVVDSSALGANQKLRPCSSAS